MKLVKIVFNTLFLAIWLPAFLIIGTFWALIHRIDALPKNPRLVWGSTPILNNKYWATAMKSAGFHSETYTLDFYSSINNRNDWGRILSEEFKGVPSKLKPYLGFLDVIMKYDILFLSFDGFFLGNTPIWWIQAYWIKLAGKKTVILPYGSDAYSYRNIKSTSLIHGLMMSYPQAAKIQDKVEKRVHYWTKHSDVQFSGIMGFDGFGRWDILVPTILYIDLEIWQPSRKKNMANGISDYVTIVHAPNHRGFKGTEFIIKTIEILQKEGLKIRFILLEKLQNSEVNRILNEDADILLEQLVATGHGLNAMEGLASALPVVSNLEDESYMLPLRRWSYFEECPIVSGTPENLEDVLRKLITRPELRNQLGDAGRKYVEKYHGLDSARFVFGEIIEFLQGNRESLINLFHPLLGEYPNRSPKIVHPLVKNRIVD
jgi:glycosyltransferase involved in cell wall biosynthesis